MVAKTSTILGFGERLMSLDCRSTCLYVVVVVCVRRGEWRILHGAVVLQRWPEGPAAPTSDHLGFLSERGIVTYYNTLSLH